MENRNSLISKIIERIGTEEQFSFINDLRFYSNRGSSIIDLVILKNKEFFIALFFKESTRDILEDLIDVYPSTAKYIIVTNGDKFNIYQNDGLKIFPLQFSSDFNELIIFIKNDISDLEVAKLLQTLSKEIQEISYEIFRDSDSQKIISFLSETNLANNIEYNLSGGYFQFKESFEFDLFNTYLEDLEEGTNIFRYTTLDGGFQTIKNESLRMSGLPGMNDVSEVGYVESYINNSNVYEFWNDTNHISNIVDINRRFIACCTTLGDELNTWRIYGEYAKGSSLVFEVGPKVEKKDFILKKVRYGINRNGTNYDSLLELFKRINLRRHHLGLSPIRIKNLHIWKHFFKSFEYSNEKEVRLLCIIPDLHNIDGWVLTASHSILNPYINIKLNDETLPIQLKKIILGPISPEKQVNKRQFEVLKNHLGLSIDIELSKILSYR